MWDVVLASSPSSAHEQVPRKSSQSTTPASQSVPKKSSPRTDTKTVSNSSRVVRKTLILDSVLRARDMYLKPDGIMVPSHCNIRLAPISDADWIADSTSEKFWKDIYGFDFSPMVPGGLLNTHEIGVFDVPEKALCGSATSHLLEMKTVSVQDLSFKVPLRMTLDRDVASLEAIAIWFDTIFINPGSSQDVKTLDNVDWGKNGIPGLGFSTGPNNTPTHWHQAVLLLDKEVAEKQVYKKGTVLEGSLTYAKEKGDDRGITVTVEWKGQGEDDGVRAMLKGKIG
jgi:protein arginine N-methyltransferase 3